MLFPAGYGFHRHGIHHAILGEHVVKLGSNLPRNIFIISSTEAKPIARAVKANFEREAEVDIWQEDIFELNRTYLDTLLNRASYYDYAIAVFAADDMATIREKSVPVTRDNVIFEFGLFLGRLGPDRTFLLQEEGVDLFSDWSGIETASFRRRDNLVAAVGAACNRFRSAVVTAERLPHFSMLPSTALAMGYYNNFLKKVFDAFKHTDFFIVGELDAKGQIVKEERYRITDRQPLVHVKLPRRLYDLDPDSLVNKTSSSYRQIAVITQSRKFPFYIGTMVESDTQKLSLFDFPSTMLASKIAIEEIFDPRFLAQDNIHERLENREVANFETVLRKMVPHDIKDKFFEFSILE